MIIDRRTLIGGIGGGIASALGIAGPAVLASSCARASEAQWPGPDTPQGKLPKLPIGMNLSGVSDYDPGFPFRNLMLGARIWQTRNEFGPGPWNTEQAEFFEYDADGYPLEVPLQTPGGKGYPQQVFTLLPNMLTPGRYVLYYDGEGSFTAFMGTRIVTEEKGRVVLQMSHKEGLVEGLAIRRSKRGNHVRNIRILALKDDPATLAEQPFRRELLDFCKPFHALRFMDWLGTSDAIEDEWSGRRRPSFYTMITTRGDADGFWGPPLTPFQKMYAGGVAHELVIQLANMLKIDPWICLPHRATDDYIRRCSALYREKLDPDRRVYVEYSNELWNFQYVQAIWMLKSEFAGAAVEARGLPAWEMKDGKRVGTQHPERIGALFARAYRLWLEEWRGRDRARVTTICAVQGPWVDVSRRIIEWCHREGVGDAVSGAGYFGPDAEVYKRWESRGAALTAEEVLADMRDVIAAQGRTDSTLYQIVQIARRHGMSFNNYEGGQHIQPQGQEEKPYMPALKAAQTHPAMYDLYVENLRQQRRLGSDLFCAYSSIGRQGMRWGSWGAKDSYATPDSASPKLRALLDCNS